MNKCHWCKSPSHYSHDCPSIKPPGQQATNLPNKQIETPSDSDKDTISPSIFDFSGKMFRFDPNSRPKQDYIPPIPESNEARGYREFGAGLVIAGLLAFVVISNLDEIVKTGGAAISRTYDNLQRDVMRSLFYTSLNLVRRVDGPNSVHYYHGWARTAQGSAAMALEKCREQVWTEDYKNRCISVGSVEPGKPACIVYGYNVRGQFITATQTFQTKPSNYSLCLQFNPAQDHKYCGAVHPLSLVYVCNYSL